MGNLLFWNTGNLKCREGTYKTLKRFLKKKSHFAHFFFLKKELLLQLQFGEIMKANSCVDVLT